MFVIGHQKEHVIEENEPVEKNGKYSSWKGDNNNVMSWIMNSVQPQIASTIAYYTSAKQMWDFLKQTYSNDRNVSKILQVEEELLNLQQGDQSLAQYFASLKSISERLKALRPPCPTCYKTHGEQSMVAKFLQGLSSEYAVAKAQMLTGAEIPDLADAYNRLSRLAVTLSSPSSDIHASALAAAGGRGRGWQHSSAMAGDGDDLQQSTATSSGVRRQPATNRAGVDSFSSARRRRLTGASRRLIGASCRHPIVFPPSPVASTSTRNTSAARPTTSVACCRPSLHIRPQHFRRPSHHFAQNYAATS
ncbi:hypothetical protein EJ110_NYTH58036 [Nymphaea thermarum]|nr:hypothetical protein EJ110_NYTH58036 [Nymphaea thermarum]